MRADLAGRLVDQGQHRRLVAGNAGATATLVPWKMVPVRTENCFRQLAHFHTRRTLMVRLPSAFLAPVPRLVLLAGLRKYALSCPQWGQIGVPCQRRSSSRT